MNRVPKLKPKERYRSEITLSAHLGKDEVQKVKTKIERIQGKVKPKIHRKPVKEF
jgi:hypothetical protein